ncbi:MAG TPA: AAA family ATPase [Pseudonocardiaceae bacterium]|jgi:predicted kinase|nr:AAA family ATPase [Pseudonocardiaceae bacterium]
MARLILLNGPPASGKSTLARRYAADHAGTLILDIDLIRRRINGWQADQHRSGLLAREIAIDLARGHLAAGGEVLVPQFLARPEFIERLARLAEESTVEFRELALLGDREAMLRRFAARSAAAAEPAHVEAAEQVARDGGMAALADSYDRLLALLETRPNVRRVASIDGDVELTYRHLLRALT